MHKSLTDRAWMLPNRLTDMIANKSTILKEGTFSKADWSGSNGEHVSAYNTKVKSQVGIVEEWGEFNRLVPHRNLITRGHILKT